MSGFLDDQSIDIPCPNCGKEHPRTIGWIKSNNKISCECGANINLDKSQFVDELKKAEDALDSFPREITIKL